MKAEGNVARVLACSGAVRGTEVAGAVCAASVACAAVYFRQFKEHDISSNLTCAGRLRNLGQMKSNYSTPSRAIFLFPLI